MMLQFESGSLGNLIIELQEKQFCGVAHIGATLAVYPQRKENLLLFNDGEMIYGGDDIPDPHSLSKYLAKRFNLPMINEAFQLAQKKLGEQVSHRQCLELYVQLGLTNWQDVEKNIRNQLVVMLEWLLPCSGTLTLEPSSAWDWSYGFNPHGFTFNQLNQRLKQRQRAWSLLAPDIPSMYAIPQQLDKQHHTIDDPAIQKHLNRFVDGQQSLFAIAHKLEHDPLKLARGYYLHFVQKGWIQFIQEPVMGPEDKSTVEESERPIVLSVDDSRVVQTMIKRTICDRYKVLLANNAVDALKLLNSNDVALMLLDVTMPEIDGLELCRTIRSIGKFRNLPVIMLTARDGMFNKLKGQMAGSTHYLTKPVERQKLLDLLQKYIPSPITI